MHLNKHRHRPTLARNLRTPFIILCLLGIGYPAQRLAESALKARHLDTMACATPPPRVTVAIPPVAQRTLPLPTGACAAPLPFSH